MGRGGQISDFTFDPIQDIVFVFPQLIIIDPQHPYSKFLKYIGSSLIVFGLADLIVDSTIQFNDKFQFMAVKVSDVVGNRMLSPELKSKELSVLK